eukprot:3511686-Prymnesium_polylepis.1
MRRGSEATRQCKFRLRHKRRGCTRCLTPSEDQTTHANAFTAWYMRCAAAVIPTAALVAFCSRVGRRVV